MSESEWYYEREREKSVGVLSGTGLPARQAARRTTAADLDDVEEEEEDSRKTSKEKSKSGKIPVTYPDATKPEIYKFNDAEREAMGELDADEMHFVPIPNESWSVSLLRYLPNRSNANVDYSKPPVIFIPGCASNAYTFDVDAKDGFSMPRLCAEKLNREVWICESRGVGHARNHGRRWRATRDS